MNYYQEAIGKLASDTILYKPLVYGFAAKHPKSFIEACVSQFHIGETSQKFYGVALSRRALELLQAMEAAGSNRYDRFVQLSYVYAKTHPKSFLGCFPALPPPQKFLYSFPINYGQVASIPMTELEFDKLHAKVQGMLVKSNSFIDKSNSFIEAIKEIRHETQWGLREARGFVEAIKDHILIQKTPVGA
jgi:hypothetical protein